MTSTIVGMSAEIPFSMIMFYHVGVLGHFASLAPSVLASLHSYLSLTNPTTPLLTAPASQKNLHPLDAPKYTLRYLLIKLMTHKDTDVKRIVSELMWSMCGKDEFVNRVGFGNAVWWLSVMGVVKVPGVA